MIHVSICSNFVLAILLKLGAITTVYNSFVFSIFCDSDTKLPALRNSTYKYCTGLEIVH